MFYRVILCALCVWAAGQARAQDTLILSLEQTIQMAQGQAPEVQIAKTSLSNNFWQFQSFLADYRPQVDLGATLPDVNRSIEAVTQPNGEDIFVERALMRNDLGLTLSQQVGFSGGRIFAQTGLQRIDILPVEGTEGKISYLSTPISIGIQQPIFQFNALRWAKRIEPLRFEVAQRFYSEDLEEVAFTSAQIFFQVLIAQFNLQAATRDRAEADSLYTISQGRFEVGRIAETDLLQFELQAMNADADLQQSMLDLQTSTERLRDFLGIQEAVQFRMIVPSDIPVFDIDPQQALQYARANRSEPLDFALRRMSARRDMAEAKGNSGLNMDIFASFGLSQTGNQLSDAYTEPLDQERLIVGLDIPIADWGKTRAQREIAQSNLDLTRRRVAQDSIAFEREVLVKTQQLDLVRDQVNLALRTYEVAQKRRDISRLRYLVGKIAVTDLNLAIREEINARRNYINALRNFWLAYFDLRRLTLYDYQQGRSLVRPAAETGLE